MDFDLEDRLQEGAISGQLAHVAAAQLPHLRCDAVFLHKGFLKKYLSTFVVVNPSLTVRSGKAHRTRTQYRVQIAAYVGVSADPHFRNTTSQPGVFLS